MKHDLSNKTEDELLELLHTKVPTGDLYIAAKIQYEKLLRKRNFWSKDIVAWLALVFSLGSLIVSIIALVKKP